MAPVKRRSQSVRLDLYDTQRSCSFYCVWDESFSPAFQLRGPGHDVSRCSIMNQKLGQ